jgi:hypothetical protein
MYEMYNVLRVGLVGVRTWFLLTALGLGQSLRFLGSGIILWYLPGYHGWKKDALRAERCSRTMPPLCPFR